MTSRPDDTQEGTALEDVAGVVENVVFHADHSGYTVCAVRIPGQRDTVTVVGNCPAIWIGENLTARGKWVQHKRHGHQFQADEMTCLPPTSARGIERYLASGMIRGIGKVNAKRLVDHFGDDTLRIIEKESSRLEEVEGIGSVRRKLIKESWEEQRGIREVMIFLQGHGIGTAQAARIFRQYGQKAIDLIRENPYRLCREVWGIGFKTADSVAMSVGIPPRSEVRARAGLEYVLETLTNEGHCFCPEPELLLQSEALLDIPVEILSEALNKEVQSRRLVRENDHIYLAAIYAAETGIAAKVLALRAAPLGFRPIVADKAVEWAEQQMSLSLAAMQRDALHMALSEKISIITGGPGVGKTTLIRALVDVFGARRLTVMLAAPTGRAAKRMEEATGHRAQTIHRLLKYSPRTHDFEHGPDNPLEADVVILDEVSMIDVLLMQAFMGALPDACCLILVGDVDQLPSVGPGNVLTDLIESERVPCRQLETIFRQEAGGWIVQNAHRVNHGEYLELPQGEEDSDFYYIEVGEPQHAVNCLTEVVTRRMPRRFGLDPMADIQVLTPMRKNMLGADNLNVVLQQALNPRGPSIQRFGKNYRMADRVMQIRNNYDKDVFNGDIGHIANVDPEEQQIVVDYDGRQIAYDFAELDELVHAYACTIHKSQGSEYPAVVILMTTHHYKLLQRNLLYTAITRGRKLVCLLGSRKAIHIAIHNNEIKLRRTGLRARLASGDRSGAGQV